MSDGVKDTGFLAAQGVLFKKLHESAIIPTRAYEGDMGWDLYWCAYREPEMKEYQGLTVVRFTTGIAMSLPWWWGWEIRERSSMAWKYGASVAGGIIDSGFRGELFVVLRFPHPLTAPYPFRFDIKPGDKIAQLLIRPNPYVEPSVVDELPPSERGQKGYGSSGA